MKFTSTVLSDDIKSVNDFPQLTLKQIRKNIVFGNFKMKQSLSYIGQIIDHGRVYFLNEKLLKKYVTHDKVINELHNSKILAVLIPSRHKRGKKWKSPNSDKNEKIDSLNPKNFNTYYKVFIQYVPVQDKSEKHEINHHRLIKSN